MINRNENKGVYSHYKGWRKLLALLCAFTLLASSCGVAAFAEEDDDIYSVPVTAPGSTLKHTPSPGDDPEETPAPEEEEVEYAAGSLIAEAGDCYAQIDYPAEARIPEGARLVLEAGDGKANYRGLKAAARLVRIDGDETSGREVAEEGYQFYTLTIVDADGNAVQPAVPVTLSFRKAESPEGVNWLLAGDLPRFLAADQGGISVADYEMEMIGYVRITERPTEPVTLEYAGPDYTVIATYGPDAGFPADTELTVREIMPGTPEYALYSGMTEEALNEEWSEITLERYFDITFISGGVELEPQGNVDVQIVFREAIELTDEHDVSAVHIENNEATVIESETEGAGQDEEAIDKVTFTADSFSVFGVVQRKKIIKKVLAADGQTYEINVEYGPEAEIPEGAELQVVEIEEGSDLWEAYRKQTAAALGASDVRLPGLYDITIIDAEGVAVEPKAPVNVSIRLANADEAEETLHVVHFTEEIPEELVAAAAEEKAEEQAEVQPLAEEDMIASETIADAVTEGDTVTFETDGFSVYAFAYTVDFHYIVDGQRYDFSIPGGGFVTFSQIMELLHIPTARGAVRDAEEQPEDEHVEAEKVYFIPDVAISEGTRNFVDQIESITFSSPELVSVSKAEETTTIGQIKEKLKLECECSSELTEKNIEDINAQTVEAGDWVLISVLPFTTEEWLTVTMKDGEVFTVKVTDAQIRTTFITASGEMYEITVTYNDTAEIPDDAQLQVREIMNDEEKYAGNIETANRILASEEGSEITQPVQFEIAIVNAEGEEIEPREGALVGVEIKLVPEIFEQVNAEINEEETGEETAEEEEDKAADGPQMCFLGGSIDIEEALYTNFTVTHIISEEEVQVIDDVNSSVSEEDGRIVLQFETESFSDYLLNRSGQYYESLDYLPKTIYVGDVIYMFNLGDMWVTNNHWIVEETQHEGNSKYKTVEALRPGTFKFTTTNFTEDLKEIEVKAASEKPGLNQNVPSTIETVSNSSIGMTVNLFDYDAGHYLDDRFNNYDYYSDGNTDIPVSVFKEYGINAGHYLKFQGSGTGGSAYGNYNSYTEHGIRANIVQNHLDGNGYPMLYGGEESLAYLFDGSADGTNKKAYLGADGLFKKEGDYYVYDSNVNYAYFDGSKFNVYSRTYEQKSRDDGGEQAQSTNGKAIGFFPFHPWDEKYDQFVNWNKSLNHHFGLSMEVKFTLPKDPKAVTDSEGNPIVFEFSGDDDMWVFIDDVLVMDIGGIHQPIEGSINFQTGVVTVANQTQMDSETFRNTFANTGGINLYDGKKHTLKVFYLERGGCDSNCKIKFNLTQYGDLNFTKTDESGHSLAGAIFAIYKDPECTQPLKEVLKSGISQDYIAVADENGHVEFNDLPLGKFYVKEIYTPTGYNLEHEPHISELVVDKVSGGSGEEIVKTTLDGEDVGEDYHVTVTNRKTSVKAEKEWYQIPVGGTTANAVRQAGGDPVTMILKRSTQTVVPQNNSGTGVNFRRNGDSGCAPFVLTCPSDGECKTGDTIQITITSTKPVFVKMDHVGPNGYHGEGAFGAVTLSAAGTKKIVKTIESGIGEINFGIWDSSIQEGDVTIDVDILRRPDSAISPEDAETIDTVELPFNGSWEYTWTELDGTDENGNEYVYTVEEAEAGQYSTVYEKTTDEDGTEVWTVKNYTDQPNGQTVKLRKRDKNGGAAIPGVEFQMFTEDPEANPNAEPINITDELIAEWKIKTNQMGASSGTTLVSDAEGRFYSGFLPSGTYYIKETKAKEGYIRDNTVHRIRVTSSGMDIWDPEQNQWTPRDLATNKDYYELYIENERIPTTSLTVLKKWQNVDAPEGATVQIVVRRYRLVDEETTGPDVGEETGTLTISDGYSGLEDESAYSATYTVSGEGVTRSGNSSIFAALPVGGPYTVSKTVAAVDGYDITAYGTEELTGIYVTAAGGAATFHDTVFEQQTTPTPSGTMNVTINLVLLEGRHSGQDFGIHVPNNWHAQNWKYQYTNDDTYHVSNMQVFDDNNEVITYNFSTGNYWQLAPGDVVTITSNPASVLGGKTRYTEANSQIAGNMTLKAQSGEVVITITVGPDSNSGAAGYTAKRSWIDTLISSASADDAADIHIPSAAPSLPTVSGKQWVADGDWSETITLTGPWTKTITVDGKDVDGNLYVYYIDEVFENGIPNPGNWAAVKDGQIVWGDHETSSEHSGDTLSVTNRVTKVDDILTPVDIPIEKVDETNEPMPGIDFGVFAQAEDTDPLDTATTGSDGTATLTIPAASAGTHGGVNDTSTQKTFILKETTPEGYASESPWVVTIRAASAVTGTDTITYYWTLESVAPQGNSGTGIEPDANTAFYTIVNTSIPKVTVTARKDWQMVPNSLGAKAIQFTLTRSCGEGDDQTVQEVGTAVATQSNGFEAVWEDLDKYVNVLDDPLVPYTYHVEETGVFFGEPDGNGNVPDDGWIDAHVIYSVASDPADGDVVFDGNTDEGTISFTNTPDVDIPFEKTWTDLSGDEYGWTATFQLKYREKKVSGAAEDTAVADWTNAKDISGNDCLITISKAEGADLETASGVFEHQAKYRVDGNGNVYERQYTVEETAYNITRNGEPYTPDADYVFTVDSYANDGWDQRDYAIAAHNNPPETSDGKLIVKKHWRGVPEVEADAYPAIRFNLMRGPVTEWGIDTGRAVVIAENQEISSATGWQWTYHGELPAEVDGVAVGYYAVETTRSGSIGKTEWELYGYSTDDYNPLTQKYGRVAGRDEANRLYIVPDSSGAFDETIVIHNAMKQYGQIDIKKKFIFYGRGGVEGQWDTDTDLPMPNTVIGFVVIRKIYDQSSGAVLKDWHDYGKEILVGYDQNLQPVSKNPNDFYLGPGTSAWCWTIYDQGGGLNNDHVGLPIYGYYTPEGSTMPVPVSYAYSIRETNVYANLNKALYQDWEWWSTITPPKGKSMDTSIAQDEQFYNQADYPVADSDRVNNYQASDLSITKKWLNDEDNGVQEIFIKVWRMTGSDPVTKEDFTEVIADDITHNHNWQGYIKDNGTIDLEKKALVLKNTNNWSARLKVQKALLASIQGSYPRYSYYVEEIGYTDYEGNYHEASTFDPHYVQKIDGVLQPEIHASGAGAGVELGEVGRNGLQIYNAATMNVNVQKKWLDGDGTTEKEPEAGTTATIQIKQIFATDSSFTQNTGERILSFRIGSGSASPDLTVGKAAVKYNATVTAGTPGEYTLAFANAMGRDNWTLFIDGLQKYYIDEQGTVYYCKYEVIEQPLSGFTVRYTTDGEDDVRTVTASGSTVEITNRENGGTLTVTKTVTGAYTPTADDAYPITIMKGEQYLNADCELVGENPGLTIKDRQTLTFDVPAGEYIVSEGEAGRTGYTVVTTYTADPGTAEATQAAAEVETEETAAVTITNHYRNAELVITKTIEGVNSTDLSDVAGTVSFTVTNAEGTTVLEQTALTDSIFTASADGKTYTATLNTANNALILPDGVYTVTETTTDAQGYILTSTKYMVTTGTPGAGNDTDSKTGSLQLIPDGDTSRGRIDFTNTYTTAETTIDVIKKDSKTENPLQGAEFKLTKLAKNGNTWTETEIFLVSGPTGSDGKVMISGLTTGRWRLAETKAPDGYIATPETIDIEVSVVNNKAVVTKPESVQLQMIQFADGVITVDNSAGAELPTTGGSGTTIYTLAGLALVILAAALLLIRRRKASRN